MTMGNLRALKNTLIGKGVSWRNATRYVRELEHHYDDLFVEAKLRGLDDRTAAFLAEQALGSEEDLVREMASRPELRSLGQRYPKLCYLALPSVLFVLVGVSALFLIATTMSTFFSSTMDNYVEPAPWVKSAVESFRLFLMHVMAPLLSAVFLVLGLRNRIDRKILFTGILLANLIGCALQIYFQWPDPATGAEGFLGASFGYNIFGFRGVMDTKIRLLLTLAILALFGSWYRRYLLRN